MRPRTSPLISTSLKPSSSAQVLKTFFSLVKGQGNGESGADDLTKLTHMVCQNEILQKRRDVLNALARLHGMETDYYDEAARKASGKLIPQHKPYAENINHLAMAMLSCMKHRKMDQRMESRYSNHRQVTILETTSGIAHSSSYALDVRMTAFELLPWDVEQSRKRKMKKATPRIYGDDTRDVDYLLDYCKKIFITKKPDPDIQRRMFSCFKNPFITNITANRYNWMGGDHSDKCIIDILELPVRYAIEKDVREDAIALSYRYIKEKIPQKIFVEKIRDRNDNPIQSKLGIQADYLVRLSRAIKTDYPVEAAYLRDESILVQQEHVLQQKLYDFAKTTTDMTTQRNYSATMKHLHATSSMLIEEQRSYQKQQSAFHTAHAAPEILLRMF